MTFEDEVRQAITELHSIQTKHLNLQLADEALLDAMLDLVPPAALDRLAEKYEDAKMRLAMALPPEHQLPELWEKWTAAIEDRRQHLQRAATRKPASD